MAFDLAAVGGFSSGKLCHAASVSNPTLAEVIGRESCSDLPTTGFWAEIDSFDGKTIKTGFSFWGDSWLEGSFQRDLTGCDLLIHHSLCKSTSPSEDVIANLGKYEVRHITACTKKEESYTATLWHDTYEEEPDITATIRRSVYYFTLDKAPDIDLENFYVQAVLILEFENLDCTPEENDYRWLHPKPFGILGDVYTFFYTETGEKFEDGNPFYYAKHGGILAMRVRNTLTFSEVMSYYDNDAYNSGTPNAKAGGLIDLSHSGIADYLADYRPLTPQERNGTSDTDPQSGAENSITKDRFLLNVGDGALFLIAKNIVTVPTTRFGHYDNKYYYAPKYCQGSQWGRAGHGGSTMLIVCNNWTGFDPKIISKYFSDATVGTYYTLTVPPVRNPKGLGRCYIACGNLTPKLLADEGLYALDAIRTPTRLNLHCNINNFGYGTGGDSYVRNYYSGIRSISSDGKTFTLNSSIGTVGGLVMIHQLQKNSGEDVDSGKFTLARITEKDNNVITVDTAFPIDLDKYYGQMITLCEHGNLTIDGEISAGASWNAGVGGILAIVCYGTLDIRGAKLLVEGQGTHNNVVNKLVGNNFMRSRLYIGQGHGTVFLLARKIIMNSSTRIGGIYPGTHFGGPYSTTEGHYDANSGGGYRGKDGSQGQGGWGGGAGPNGGWFSNAPNAAEGTGLQGAHILIISDTIEDFRLNAISTGGRGFSHHGGAGYGGGGINYGGGGGYRGGGEGGGGAGAAFIYCNKVVNQSTTGIVTA